MKKTAPAIVLPVILSLSALLAFTGCQGNPQKAENLKTFDWMVKTFEENDAGFRYHLEEKGEEDYARHTAAYRKKIGNAPERELTDLMNEWLHYFRKGHIGIYPDPDRIVSEAEKDSWRELYKSYGNVGLDESGFKRYLRDNKNDTDPIEGIWEGKHSIIVGVIRSKDNESLFEIFCTKGNDFRESGTRIGELKLNDDGSFDIKHYTSKLQKKIRWTGSSHSIISLNGRIYSKTYPETERSDKERFFLEGAFAKEPYLEALNDKTLYLRIPSFLLEEKAIIDKVIAQNDALIRKTPNLIIDIRNSTGGSDYSHYGLIPYYYTQPIHMINHEYFATESNARSYENLSDSNPGTAPGLTERAKNIALTMRENSGNYITIGPDIGNIDSYIPLKYPERIAILSRNNASSDEGFLYMARQSYKTKIFGKPSQGAFDISNLNRIKSPDGKYILEVAMSISKRIHDYKIDGTGIQPDFYMDDWIDEADWVEYAQSVLEAR